MSPAVDVDLYRSLPALVVVGRAAAPDTASAVREALGADLPRCRVVVTAWGAPRDSLVAEICAAVRVAVLPC